ncbi:glycoside hydrolase domain-containing protein [Sphingobacterium sp. MYb382]|uniref:glycoside hydrolase domain-containing protein n=1 Tax=Sphingobacterium sp. MYb382 TaxID=2745278 RepID=UPI0030A36D01
MKYPVLVLLVISFFGGTYAMAKTKPNLLLAIQHGKGQEASLNWKSKQRLSAKVAKGELYIFELSLFAKNQEVKDVRIKLQGDLLSKGKMGILSKSFFRFADNEKALQEEGVMLEPFALAQGDKHKVYCAVKIPVYISPTTFSGTLNIEVDGEVYTSVDIQMHVSPNMIKHTRFSEQ